MGADGNHGTTPHLRPLPTPGGGGGRRRGGRRGHRAGAPPGGGGAAPRTPPPADGAAAAVPARPRAAAPTERNSAWLRRPSSRGVTEGRAESEELSAWDEDEDDVKSPGRRVTWKDQERRRSSSPWRPARSPTPAAVGRRRPRDADAEGRPPPKVELKSQAEVKGTKGKPPPGKGAKGKPPGKGGGRGKFWGQGKNGKPGKGGSRK